MKYSIFLISIIFQLTASNAFAKARVVSNHPDCISTINHSFKLPSSPFLKLKKVSSFANENVWGYTEGDEKSIVIITEKGSYNLRQDSLSCSTGAEKLSTVFNNSINQMMDQWSKLRSEDKKAVRKALNDDACRELVSEAAATVFELRPSHSKSRSGSAEGRAQSE